MESLNIQKTVRLHLEVDEVTSQVFTHHLETFNAACNYVATYPGFEMCANYYDIDKVMYYKLAEMFPELPKASIQQAEGKVVGATSSFSTKLNRLQRKQAWLKAHGRTLRKRSQRQLEKMESRTHMEFNPHGSAGLVKSAFKIDREQRTLTLSVCGHMSRNRVHVRFSMNKYDRALLDLPDTKTCQARLVRARSGGWQLHLTIARQVSAPSTYEVARRKKLGIDLGVKNHVATSTGMTLSALVSAVRLAHIRKVNASLQSKNTRNSRRRLHKRRGYYSRYQQDVQRCVARDVVNEALEQGCLAIIAEDLKEANRPNAAKGHALGIKFWAYAQQLKFIEQAAALHGLAVYTVPPAHTSDTCPACGWSHPLNRVERDTFRCTHCGYTADADINAAQNIVAKFETMPLLEQSKCKLNPLRRYTPSL